MRVLLFLKIVYDTNVSVLLKEETKRIRDDWNVKIINPFDISALFSALELKKLFPELDITVIHLGPKEHEEFLIKVLSLGVDRAIRVFDEEVLEKSFEPRLKAFIFEKISKIVGFDLILLGEKSLDRASGQVAALLATRLDIPFVRGVERIEGIEEKGAIVIKTLERGYKKRLFAPFPSVLAFGRKDERSFFFERKILYDKEGKIEKLDFSDLGITKEVLRRMRSLEPGSILFPRPKLKYVEAPSSSLQAFERIKRIVEGQTKKREAKILRGDKTFIAEKLFSFLVEEGWIDIKKQ